MIPVTGFSLKLRDKRVDKKLEEIGYTDLKIFYSPINMHFALLPLLLISLLPVLDLVIYIPWNVWVAIGLYLILRYFVCAYLNNSFALSETELIVVNPNFPFRHVTKYRFEKISSIYISETYNLFLYAFLLFEQNYVKINGWGQLKRHYCVSLCVDAYDENFTEFTMDDFHADLKTRGLNVDFKL